MSSTGETDESEDDYTDLILSAERLYRLVHNKRKRGEARLNVNKINKIVLQTLKDILEIDIFHLKELSETKKLLRMV